MAIIKNTQEANVCTSNENSPRNNEKNNENGTLKHVLVNETDSTKGIPSTRTSVKNDILVVGPGTTYYDDGIWSLLVVTKKDKKNTSTRTRATYGTTANKERTPNRKTKINKDWFAKSHNFVNNPVVLTNC
jgi:hypothetical protein